MTADNAWHDSLTTDQLVEFAAWCADRAADHADRAVLADAAAADEADDPGYYARATAAAADKADEAAWYAAGHAADAADPGYYARTDGVARAAGHAALYARYAAAYATLDVATERKVQSDWIRARIDRSE